MPDQLIHSLLGQRAVALGININPVSGARWLSIDEYAKSQGCSERYRSHDEMQIARVKAVHNAPVGLVQHRGLLAHRPVAGKGPVIEVQLCGDRIDAGLVRCRRLPMCCAGHVSRFIR